MAYVTVLLSLATIYSGIKWISYFYGLAGMIHYMEENNMKPPNDEEIKKAINWAYISSINNFKLKLKFKKLS